MSVERFGARLVGSRSLFHMMSMRSEVNGMEARVSSGIPDLDLILGGGLTMHRTYLLEGTPGSGKTTLALQFLLAGAKAGEKGLYITLSETASELREVARSHAWSLEGIELFELVNEQRLDPDR